MDKKLIVLFPGVRYSTDCPLLYYAKLCYERRGYEVREIHSYEVDGVEGLADLDTYAVLAEQNVKRQLRDVEWENYSHVVFASKSIGTVIALWLEDELSLPSVSHILLTPLNQTLPFLEQDRCFRCIVTGTDDSFVDLGNLREICMRKKYPLTVIDGVGHRLETEKNVMGNLEILKQMIQLY